MCIVAEALACYVKPCPRCLSVMRQLYIHAHVKYKKQPVSTRQILNLTYSIQIHSPVGGVVLCDSISWRTSILIRSRSSCRGCNTDKELVRVTPVSETRETLISTGTLLPTCPGHYPDCSNTR